jgi:nucleoside 2-deoxyribosyltransferase
MKYFLSVPFSSRVDGAGNVLAEYRQIIEQLILGLRAAGHEVFCALEHTKWSMDELAVPEDEFRKDLAEIDACDELIILLEERVSAGVQIENGYAYAKGKKLQTYQIGKSAWSNMAFSKLSGAEIVQVKDINDFAHQVLRRCN